MPPALARIDEPADNGICSSVEFSTDEFTIDDDEHFGDHDDDKTPIGIKETTAIRRLSWMVTAVLLAATACVSVAAYEYTHHNEVNDFEETFASFSEMIIDAVQINVQNTLEAIAVLALGIQGYAINSNSTWPFVTVPFFEEYVIASKSLIDAQGVMVFPIVADNQRAQWEEYAVQHRYWINNSYAAQREIYGIDGLEQKVGTLPTDNNNFSWYDVLWGADYHRDDAPDFTTGIASTIFKTRHADDEDDHRPSVEDTPGPYFPQWQAAPMSHYYQTTVNCNYAHYEDFLNQTKIVNETGAAAFGLAWTDRSSAGYLSTLLYPIYDTFYGNKTTVAYISFDIFWQGFLKGILPPRAEEIYVVIDSCDQYFTYKLLGNNVEYIGEGDLHDTAYDYLEQSTIFGQPLMEPVTSPTYTGRPLYDKFCPYTFHIFPSQNMEQHYVTNDPVMYSAVACLIFLFTSLIFVGYDHLVERRQKLVLHSATQADRVVSSLFPADVKSRLYEGQQEKDQQDKDNLNTTTTSNATATATTKKCEEERFDSDYLTSGILKKDGISPIAELYPETTVLFADIAGFTSWSSERSPPDVFLLLETLYGRFDKTARKLGVFKVETIGDCYVAATGIPRPQKRHALIMTNFARECQVSFNQELAVLAETLGPDTLNLGMRVGIHSGPVTAGVLRGDKARFQLFGDTMNTASRMESNGVPNRIHISKETADLLRSHGKSHWIHARQDLIVAKGKGEMQTFWVDSKREHSISLNESSLHSKAHSSYAYSEADDDDDEGNASRRSSVFFGDDADEEEDNYTTSRRSSAALGEADASNSHDVVEDLEDLSKKLQMRLRTEQHPETQIAHTSSRTHPNILAGDERTAVPNMYTC